MRLHRNLVVAGIGVVALLGKRVQAQFNVIDETRWVICNGSGQSQFPGGTVSTFANSQTSTSPGTFDEAQGGILSLSVPVYPPADAVIGNNTGSQNSLVSTSLFSDTAGVSESYAPVIFVGDINTDSYYETDFSVSAPTPFVITAQYSMTGAGEGPLGTVSSYITLSQNGAALFSTGPDDQAGGGTGSGGAPGLSYSGGPTSYVTTLVPGNTYEIVADAYIDRPLTGTSDGSEQGGVSFIAAVPEPGCLALLAVAGVGMLARRR